MALGVLGWAACDGPGAATPSEPATLVAPAGGLRRLTRAQYGRSVRDALGDAVVVPAGLEPDVEASGFIAVGMSLATVSPHGAEQYEAAAYAIASQVLGDPALYARNVTCTPEAEGDEACWEVVARQAGLRLWRRPLAEGEVTSLVSVAAQAAQALGSFDAGVEFLLATLLQSPHFLFRSELGQADPAGPAGPPGMARLDAYELATRLSYFLWNTTPDDALLAAAASGALDTAAGREAEVDRLLASPRVRDGIRQFWSERYQLHALDALSKDPTIFLYMHSELGPAAREETLLGLDDLVFDREGDYREMMTTRESFLDRRLAALYDVPAPAPQGFARASFPDDHPRRGLLGQASVLTLNAHAVSSSATKRGMFVRQKLLCTELPPPPADVDTSIPEPKGEALTLRDRVKEHLTVEKCAVCHLLMDPIGLGLENFDGIGRWRELDHGGLIDPSGDLDAVPFKDASELGRVIAEDPRFAACLGEHLWRYASGRAAGLAEEDALEWLGERFEAGDRRVLALVRALAVSELFRRVGEVTE